MRLNCYAGKSLPPEFFGPAPGLYRPEPRLNQGLSGINAIFSRAVAQGRFTLLEPEVYEVLRSIGINTPTYSFVRDERSVTRKLLHQFGRKIVLKIVSPDILHKSDVNGVRVVENNFRLVRTACRQMQQNPKIEGIMLCEYIDLGNDSLRPFRELIIGTFLNEQFGQILSFGKGGFGTELQRDISSRLVPLSRDEILKMMAETKISSLLFEEYRGFRALADRDKLAEAIYQISNFVSQFPGPYAIEQLEINPLAIDKDGRLIALDGLLKFRPKEQTVFQVRAANTRNMDALLKPKTIAVVGASDYPTKSGTIILKLLIEGTKGKKLYAVNLHAAAIGSLQGCPCYEKVSDIPETVDLVVVTVPAHATPDVMKDIVKSQAKAVILIPGGFSETEGGKAIEQEIKKIIQDTPTRANGGNCVGIFVAGEYNTIFMPEERLFYTRRTPEADNNVAWVSQSGAEMITEICKKEKVVGVRMAISYGNGIIDLGPADYLEYLESDPQIQVFAFYVEGFRPGEGRLFFDVAQKVIKEGKTVIVYKAGRTEAGSKAASSHTAAMAGNYEICETAFKQAGIVVADTLDDYHDLTKIFSLLAGRKVRGRKTAVISNAGFECTTIPDREGSLEMVKFSEETTARLQPLLPANIVDLHNPLDLTPMTGDEKFAQVIETVLQDPGVDNLVVSIVPHTPELKSYGSQVDEDGSIAQRLIELFRKYDKPMVVSINAGSRYDRLRSGLEEAGIPCYPNGERAVKALEIFVKSKSGH